MSNVLKFSAPKAVECQGEAKSALEGLSAVALRLMELKARVPKKFRKSIEELHDDLCKVVRLMTAIDETMSVIQDHAEEIIQFCPQNVQTLYVNGITSVEAIVNGHLFVRVSTIVLENFKVLEVPESAANDMAKVLQIGSAKSKMLTYNC